MKTFQLSKNSWHYRLAHHYGDFRHDDHNKPNICDYSKEVAYGFMCVLFITFGILAVLLIVEQAMLWFVACIQVGVWIRPDMYAAIGIVVTSISIMNGLLFAHLFVKYEYEKKVSRKEASKDIHEKSGFISIWYTNLKSKTCVPIELK
jgi:hypothetical protein